MYIYVNTQFKNSLSSLSNAVSFEQRQDNIIPQNHDFELSVDRWFIVGAYLPIFKIPSSNLSISVNGSSEDVNFTSNNSNGFIYKIDDFLTAINTTFENIMDVLSLPSNSVSLSYSHSTKLFTINYTSSINNIVFDSLLGSYLSSFPNMDYNNNQWTINLNSSLTSITQFSSTIDLLCPVVRISIESNDLPVMSELLPNTTDPNILSRNLSNIISDYKYFQNDLSPIKSIVYNADGNHRWASILHGMGQFNRFSLSYFWFDYNNVKYPLQILPNGMAESKLVFKKTLE